MSCACDEWRKRLSGYGSPFTPAQKIAATFTCPKHGEITIDARPIQVTVQSPNAQATQQSKKPTVDANAIRAEVARYARQHSER